MNKRKTKKIYLLLLFIGLIGFILHIFVFEKPDGNLGFILCLTEVLLMIISTIRLCQLSKKFKDSLFKFLDIFFGL